MRDALKTLEQSAVAHAGRITPTELQTAITEQRIAPDVVANLRQRTGDTDDRARARIDRFVDLESVGEYLRPFYAETGRPSICP